jgi:hypothetical protein
MGYIAMQRTNPKHVDVPTAMDVDVDSNGDFVAANQLTEW